MPPAGELLLVAEHALERAGQLRDEDRDGVVFRVHPERNCSLLIIEIKVLFPISIIIVLI